MGGAAAYIYPHLAHPGPCAGMTGLSYLRWTRLILRQSPGCTVLQTRQPPRDRGGGGAWQVVPESMVQEAPQLRVALPPLPPRNGSKGGEGAREAADQVRLFHKP